MFRPILAAALVTGVLVPLPALAGDRTVMVRTADLNLASGEGRNRLERRIKAAARTMCGDADARNLAMSMAAKRCTTAAIESTRQQVARIQSRNVVASR